MAEPIDSPAEKPKKTRKAKTAIAAAVSTAATASSDAVASAARSPIGEQLSATKDTIRAEAQRKAGEIGDEVGKLYERASERAMDVARQGKTKAAEGLESLARVIDDSASRVDDRLGQQYGDFARSAATTVANLAGTLDQQDLDELIASTREFVKKSPAVAIGSAAVVGFMLARLLRSGKS